MNEQLVIEEFEKEPEVIATKKLNSVKLSALLPRLEGLKEALEQLKKDLQQEVDWNKKKC